MLMMINFINYQQEHWFLLISLLQFSPPPDQMITKTWVIRLEIEIDENSHPRKFIPEAINECLNLEEGEDIIDYSFICID